MQYGVTNIAMSLLWCMWVCGWVSGCVGVWDDLKLGTVVVLDSQLILGFIGHGSGSGTLR